MIGSALDVLQRDINQYLLGLFNIQEDRETIHLTTIVRNDGTVAIPADALGLSLVNIEEERVVKSQQTTIKALNGQVSHVNPEIKLNLYLLIVSNFTDYQSGLDYLAGIIRFFQSKNVFTPQNTTGLDPVIQKLIFELYTLNFEQQNHLWGSLGAKYLPSVLYKVRLIAIQEEQKADEQSPITTVNFLETVL